MGRRLWIIASILLLITAGLWLGYRRWQAHLFGNPNGDAPLVTDQKVILFAFDGARQPDGLPAPWQSRVIKGTLQADVVDAPEEPGKKALHVKCEKSHFIIWNSASPFKAVDYPVLTWSWKVTTLPEHGDVRVHSPVSFLGPNRNDAAVQVLVGFEGNDVLSYIWDSTAPVGTEVEEPSPVAKVRTQVLDSGQAHLNKWIAHSVNIYEDYRRRFGKAPGKVLGISVQTNSNHTASTGDGSVSELVAHGE